MEEGFNARRVAPLRARPGKPMDSPLIESLKSRLQEDSLNLHGFLLLEDARTKIETWRQDYNHLRPHSALSDAGPALFASQFKGSTNGRNL